MTSGQSYDLLLRGGEVLDPAQHLRGRRDIALANGCIAAIAERIDPAQARQVLDLAGKLITPGLIDIHGHYYCGGHSRAVNPDASCLPNGVTTGVDAGSAGYLNFNGFRDYAVPAHHRRVRLLGFLHVGAIGLALNPITGGELLDPRCIAPEETAHTISANRDVLLGVKIRMHVAAVPKVIAQTALMAARQAADQSDSRLMVHVSGTPIPLPQILDVLGPGDIATHILNGNPEHILDHQGRVRSEVWAARDRGVVLDVAHAGVHCDLRIARAAIEQGLIPTTISTDVHVPPPERTVYQMPDLIATFVALGMTLEDAVAASTERAARAIGREHEIGSFRPGFAADIAVFTLEEGRFTYVDAAHNQVEASTRLVPEYTIKGGEIVWTRGSVDR
jgi:dihydroorotase